MKTTIKTITLSLIAVLLSNLAIAEKNSEKDLNVYIASVANTEVAVILDKIEGETVKVKIYDAEGELVYTDSEVKGTSYRKKFTLKQLPAGKYTYQVTSGEQTVSKIVDLD